MRRLVACVILLGLCGCTGPLKTDTALVRDSAGVTIVENFGPAWSDGEAWHTSAEPAVDIGGENADANYNLFQVTDATRLRDGRLVIANAGTNELRFYDQSGRHVRTVGRRGNGPGEFRYIGRVLRAEDSLLVFDQRAFRLSAFALDGDFLSSMTMRTRAVVLERFRDGSLLTSAHRSPAEAGLGRTSTTFGRLSNDKTPPDTLTTLPGGGVYIFTRGGSSMDDIIAIHRLPFDTWPHLLTHGNGYVIVDRNRYILDIYTAEGPLTTSIRRAVSPHTVTDADRTAWRQQQISEIDDDNDRRTTLGRLEQLPFPDVLPAVETALLDDEGNFWVKAYEWPSDEAGSWSVLDSGGTWLGDVTMPAGLDVWEIGRDYVLGRWRDADELEHVRMYELVKVSQ